MKTVELTSAPTMTLDPAAAMAASMNGYGTKSATSASGLDGVTAALISVASCTASALVDGLSFQFPEMKGLRAISKTKVLGTAGNLLARKAGAKAAAEAKQNDSVRVANFIIFVNTGF
jgi:hypothetical protein